MNMPFAQPGPSGWINARWGASPGFLTVVALSFGFWGSFSLLALAANWESISAHLPMLWRFVLADGIGALLSIAIAWRLSEVRGWTAPARLVLAAALSLVGVTIYACLAAFLIAPMRADRLDGIAAGIHVLQMMFKHYWIFIAHAGVFLLLDQDRPVPAEKQAEDARFEALRTAMLGKDEAVAGMNARWFWTFQGVFWGGMFVFSTANAINSGENALNIWRIAMVESIGLVMTALAHHLAMAPSRAWPLYRRAALALTCAIALTLTYIVSIWVCYYVIFPVPAPIRYGEPIDTGFGFLLYMTPRWLFLNFPVFVGWSGFYLALDTARRLRVQERQIYNSIMLAQESQLKMLRFQLNPHFLFNTLNAISTLLLDNRNEEADVMLTRLSRFLRFTLDVAPDDQMTLSQELDAQQLYLDIESTRFGERLDVSIDVEPGVENALVPTLILQPLLENAVKYAVSRTIEPVKVHVRARSPEPGRLQISVRDTGGGNGQPLPSSGGGVGLSNIRSRLEVLYGERAGMTAASTEAGGFEVVLDLPLTTVRRNGEEYDARFAG